MLLLSKIIQKTLARKIKHNFLARVIGEKEMELIFEELKNEFIKADVNYEVTEQFFKEIQDNLREEKRLFMGKEEVQLELYQKIKDKLINSLGEEAEPLKLRKKGRDKFLLIGTNGAGKTTTVAKLAYYLKTKKGIESIETVSLDANRAAAFEQLQQLVTPLGVKSHFIKELEELQEFEEELKNREVNSILYDSGGVIPKDIEGLSYLKKLSSLVNPTETILVLDALAGQESLEIVKLFCESITVDSLIVTKSDSMSPLGAALSAHYFYKLPIKFLGEGEGIEDLIVFYPDRIVSKLLGEGDVQTLAEKIEEKEIDTNQAEKSIYKFLKGKFDLEDLILQLKEVKKFGSIGSLLKMFPSLNNLTEKLLSQSSAVEEEFAKWEVLIQSMTPYEKQNPKVIKAESSRRARIVRGSGRKVEELNRLLNKWEQTKKKAEEIGQNILTKQGDWTNIFDYLK
ncbi:signal recognition particle protein [Mycoplasma wenyonii str. Massachusetts]|uniref:signal-recognition-particle GTPase n=1 Tax=Mycoplasma wenyonii (strain Massachusetts) TaxID=1197325 RepID=I6YA61_MYCWM|nr:signal recognition particle receptor subunit alpha [Mycoplasma wenyonii]AFN64826.1 signal recognition particle protein [Mycoplasma wenyonii str. Massachusetts]